MDLFYQRLLRMGGVGCVISAVHEAYKKMLAVNAGF